MAGYGPRVRRDILRWTELGLIDKAAADALRRDIEANERKSLSFGSVLAIMAALLFGAAILLVIAANWEAFPRLLRVGALFAIILAAYVGGAFFKLRGNSAIAEGSVNASHAANAPGNPAFARPMPMPTLLLAGPGVNWQSATRSA